MTTEKAVQEVEDGLRLRGCFRVRLAEGKDKIVGDSGWHENQVTNEGVRNYLARLLGALASSSQIGYAGLGSGTVPGAAATTLDGEVEARAAVTAATSSSSLAVRFTATFASSDSFVTNTQNLSNIGLFATNTGGTLFAGNTYASSACQTNQAVNVTYDISWS